MSHEFHSELSKDYLQVFESGKYSDVTIKVGEGDDSKDYNAHIFVLITRSEFFEEEIIKIKSNNDFGNKILQYKNFDSQAFKYILQYLYGGSFNLESKEINFILNMLIISDTIKLTKLIDVLQKYLVEKRKKQLDKQFSLIHQTCSKHQILKELQIYCDKTSQLSPDIIFKADDFTNLDRDLLIFLLENKKLKLYEIQKWDHIIKWGIDQTSSLPSNITLWSKANFRDLSVTLRQMIGFINFKKISSKDFYDKVKPFKSLLEKNHYDKLLRYYLTGHFETSVQDVRNEVSLIQLATELTEVVKMKISRART